MKDKVAYLTAMTCFPVLLMIINMQMSPGSKIGAQWFSVNNYCGTSWL